MKIKIPLILRELRCQGVYKNIPGKFCCVTDKRVIDAAMKMGINKLKNNTLDNIFKSSEIIYGYFGDLYDIPLFAYEDFIEGKERIHDITTVTQTTKTQNKSSNMERVWCNQTLPLSKKGEVIKYYKTNNGYQVKWGKAEFFLNDKMIDQLLKDFLGEQEWKSLGASMDKPMKDGLGEYIARERKNLTPRHASAVAAILVKEGIIKSKGKKPIFLKKHSSFI